MSKHYVVNFFATRDDLAPRLIEAEALLPLQYATCGSFEVPDIFQPQSLVDLPSLGTSLTGDPLAPCYLVMRLDRELQVRVVPQRRNGVRYLVDQAQNQGSITLQPGGMFRGECMIPGRVATIWEDRESAELFKEYSRILTSGFKKVRSYRLGPEALGLFNSGFRFAPIGPRSPREYDLRR